jgi:hypothetical protein
MDLNAYLALNRILKKDFALKLGITTRQLTRILKGEQRSRVMALKIEEVTCGKVTRYDIKPELKGQKKKTAKIKAIQLDAFDG